MTGHYQRTTRVLTNRFAIQFPAPAPAFFPISVLRLDQVSETGQRVASPGVDVQAVLVPARTHVLTTGLTFYRDASHDERTTTTTTSLVGQLALINRAPTPVVFPTPVALGPATVAHPVRVPDASFRDVALFAQENGRSLERLPDRRPPRRFLPLTSAPTPGYDVGRSWPSRRRHRPVTLPIPRRHYARRALTGDVGWSSTRAEVSPFARIGRASAIPTSRDALRRAGDRGSIAPNVTVKPSAAPTSTPARPSAPAGSAAAPSPSSTATEFIARSGALADAVRTVVQTTNYADVRIGGVELNATAPIVLRPGVVTLAAAAALQRGTITTGVNPLDGSALDDTPADNITPAKLVLAARFTEARGRWWAEYGLRAQRQVARVPVTLAESPFTIAQDLLSLDGFGIHRLGWGVVVGPPRERLTLTFAVET